MAPIKNIWSSSTGYHLSCTIFTYLNVTLLQFHVLYVILMQTET